MAAGSNAAHRRTPQHNRMNRLVCNGPAMPSWLFIAASVVRVLTTSICICSTAALTGVKPGLRPWRSASSSAMRALISRRDRFRRATSRKTARSSRGGFRGMRTGTPAHLPGATAGFLKGRCGCGSRRCGALSEEHRTRVRLVASLQHDAGAAADPCRRLHGGAWTLRSPSAAQHPGERTSPRSPGSLAKPAPMPPAVGVRSPCLQTPSEPVQPFRSQHSHPTTGLPARCRLKASK